MITSEFKPTHAYGRQCARAYFRAVILKSWWIVPVILIFVGALIFNTSLVPHSEIAGGTLFWIGVALILIGFSFYQSLLKTFESKSIPDDRTVTLQADENGLTVCSQPDESGATPNKKISWDGISDVKEAEGCLLVFEGKRVALVVPLEFIGETMVTCIRQKGR